MSTEVDCPWREESGVIRFTVVSDGTTGVQWIVRHENKGVVLSNYAKSVLYSPHFQFTWGVLYEVAVMRGNNRTTKDICAEAEDFGWRTSNTEIACLIRDKFTDQEIEAMGLTWIIAMHNPIADSGGRSALLSVVRGGCSPWMRAVEKLPDRIWGSEYGLAFEIL